MFQCNAADDKEVMSSFESILDEPAARNEDVSMVSDDENEPAGDHFSSTGVNMPCGVAENGSDDANPQERAPRFEDLEVSPRCYPTRNRAPPQTLIFVTRTIHFLDAPAATNFCPR
jgi:hypothetical protein